MNQAPANILRFIDERPRVVATLFGSKDFLAQAKKAKKDRADILELRVDSLSDNGRSEIVAIIKKIKAATRLPVLVTVRDPKEQGTIKNLYRLSDAERLRLFSQCLPWVDLIDVELNGKITSAVMKRARGSKVKIILSHHNFSRTLKKGELRKLAQNFKKLKGDILKIAANPRDRLEVLNFMLECLSLRSTRKAFIAMGEPGKISRLAGFCFGSCLTYGFASRSAAPGQLPVKDLAQIYAQLEPSR